MRFLAPSYGNRTVISHPPSVNNSAVVLTKLKIFKISDRAMKKKPDSDPLSDFLLNPDPY